jgi:hypothetical protein
MDGWWSEMNPAESNSLCAFGLVHVLLLLGCVIWSLIGRRRLLAIRHLLVSRIDDIARWWCHTRPTVWLVGHHLVDRVPHVGRAILLEWLMDLRRGHESDIGGSRTVCGIRQADGRDARTGVHWHRWRRR